MAGADMGRAASSSQQLSSLAQDMVHFNTYQGVIPTPNLLPGDHRASALSPTCAQQGQPLDSELCQMIKLVSVSGCQCQA